MAFIKLIHKKLSVIDIKVLSLVKQVILGGNNNWKSVNLFTFVFVDWDRDLKAIFAILHMLPPTTKSRNQCNKTKAGILEDQLIIFKPVCGDINYVFNVSYDDLLKNFWEFFQIHYFKVGKDSVIYTSKMSELRTRLSNQTDL